MKDLIPSEKRVRHEIKPNQKVFSKQRKISQQTHT